MIEKFSFDIQFKKFHKKLILVKGDVETRAHVVLKLLAYILFYDERLQVEIDLGFHYKPDLAIPGAGYEPDLWVDCGYVSPAKVESLARKLKRARLVFIKSSEAELKQFKKLVQRRVDAFERLEFLAFEAGFVEKLAEALARSNHVAVYPIPENAIGVALNDEVFESNLYR